MIIAFVLLSYHFIIIIIIIISSSSSSSKSSSNSSIWYRLYSGLLQLHAWDKPCS